MPVVRTQWHSPPPCLPLSNLPASHPSSFFHESSIFSTFTNINSSMSMTWFSLWLLFPFQCGVDRGSRFHIVSEPILGPGTERVQDQAVKHSSRSTLPPHSHWSRQIWIYVNSEPWHVCIKTTASPCSPEMAGEYVSLKWQTERKRPSTPTELESRGNVLTQAIAGALRKWEGFPGCEWIWRGLKEWACWLWKTVKRVRL